MNVQRPALRHLCKACQIRTVTPADLSLALASRQTRTTRPLHTSQRRHASEKPAGLDRPKDQPMTAVERMRAAQKRAREKVAQQQKDMQEDVTKGGIAPSSVFGEELQPSTYSRAGVELEEAFQQRNPAHMEVALNPRPGARLRWQRRMVIREITHPKMNKATRIARTEREHASKSHFFKTSMKKLAPLARQIAGKSIDQAILQMRFSNKKVAQDVRKHLILARNEAIVIKGMGLGRVQHAAENTDPQDDPAETPPLAHQTSLKTLKKDETVDSTDMYIAQAWTNKGPYDKAPEYRARGRLNILRPPHTGLTVLLKEEKTRTREKQEKEAKAWRKRTGKSMWVHLPDRPITTQRQHVLW